ncbi:MAG: hypothetical protein HQ530_03665 [Parcubacteria group bacterium]|nr:hypothetical protein [Parcubacteria group bacterium]
MEIYQTKASKIAGTDFREVHHKALRSYQKIKRRSKRRPYIRSAYFNKEKIFLALFWQHLFEKKNWRDRLRRLCFYNCGLELIQKTRFEPQSRENPNKCSEILHRFVGTTPNGEIFRVQVKENKNSGQKFLISIYPKE